MNAQFYNKCHVTPKELQDNAHRRWKSDCNLKCSGQESLLLAFKSLSKVEHCYNNEVICMLENSIP